MKVDRPVNGYDIDVMVTGYPGKTVCHGGLGWSTIVLLRGHGRVAMIDTGGMGVRGLLIERPRRRRDADHLKFVANQPCLICSRIPSDAHHLRFAQPQAMSKKVSDEFTVPLCRTHHRQLHHSGNEVAWWMDMDVDPLPIAQELWRQSKNTTASTPAEPSTGTRNGQ